MTYNKPEVVKLDSALSAIQNGQAKGSHNFDSNGSGDDKATATAYEADE